MFTMFNYSCLHESQPREYGEEVKIQNNHFRLRRFKKLVKQHNIGPNKDIKLYTAVEKKLIYN